MGLFQQIKANLFLRNVILAICVLVIFVFLTQLILNWATRHGQAYSVPDFNGVTMDEAHQLAKEANLKLEINDSLYLPARTPGVVLEQNPSAGSKVKSGRRVFLTINAFSPRMAVIPYVAGYSLRQAKNNLEVAGFEIDRLVYRDDLATNNVLEQQYNGRTILPGSDIKAPAGSGVTLIVGRSTEDDTSIKVPKVVGFSLKDAKSRLWEQGLNVGKITRDEEVTEINLHQARVSRQTPGVGSVQPLGTRVDIHVSVNEAAIEAGNKAAERAARANANTAQ